MLAEVIHAAVADQESEPDEEHKDQQLGGGECVLKPRDGAHSEAVDDREECDQCSRQYFGPTEAQCNRAIPYGEERVRERREEKANVVGERKRGCGNGRGEAREKADPSGHKAPDRTVGFS